MKKVKNRLKKRMKLMDSQSINVLGNVIFAFLIQGASMLVSLFTLPAYYNYFNNNIVLGCWFTILSVLNCILTFDLGIGNGLRNQLTDAIARGNNDYGKRLISSAYFFLIPIILFIVILSWISFPFVDWNKFFNVDTGLISDKILLLSVCIIFTGVMVQFVLKLVSSCLYAVQLSSVVNLLPLISNFIILIFVKFFHGNTISDNLIFLSFVNVLAVNIPLLIATLIIFSKSLKFCRPDIHYYDLKTAINIFKIGIAFFGLQISFMFVTSLNEFLISQFSSPEYVPEYQVYYKLFNLISSICMLALTPVWSSVTKAQAEKKYTWILKIFRFFKYIAGFVFLIQFLIIPFLQFVVNVWLKNDAIDVQFHIAFVFAMANGMIIWNNVNSVVANGLGYLKPQYMYLTLAAILKIPISYLLYSITGKWYMIVFSSFLVMIPVNVIQPIMLKRYIKNKVNEQN